MQDSNQNIEQFKKQIHDFSIQNAEELEAFRIKFLGTKNILKDLFAAIKDVPNDQKKEYGQKVNELKQLAETKFADHQALNTPIKKGAAKEIDYTLPVSVKNPGARHPITLIKDELINIFSKIGYQSVDGPEIEDDWHNFSALNFPEEHPARDMQDTFFISTEPAFALRTHTSSVQVRVMENSKPPIRTISPGRVYRNEAISARAHCFFHQVEGLYIDENVSFADLKQTLLYFAQEMFSPETKIRLRPSFFPFTEPSAEMDISCIFCNGNGCNICKHTGWVEILGCGMVDPAVLENCKIDSNKYSGFAFGMGIERITMLKYNIKDLRNFSENDIRFLNQFSGL